MNHRVVAATAGVIGLAAVIAAAALAHVPRPSATIAAAMISRPARVLDPPRRQLAADEVIESSVLTIPTVTIYGEVPRRGVAEFQRPDRRAAAEPIVALP